MFEDRVANIFKFIVFGITVYALIGLTVGLFMQLVGLNTNTVELILGTMVIFHCIVGIIMLIKEIFVEVGKGDSYR